MTLHTPILSGQYFVSLFRHVDVRPQLRWQGVVGTK